MEPEQPADFSEFRMRLDNEDEVLRQAVREASNNVDSVRPGEYWLRIKGVMKANGKKHKWIRTYHVDAIAEIIEVTETYDGRETAHVTFPLDYAKYA